MASMTCPVIGQSSFPLPDHWSSLHINQVIDLLEIQCLVIETT